ncbi:hypothetical protein DICVIV_12391 [Dictyocaulus viviparus]|uniref:Uncharacterized protein n=1 Tax=Dictyocaulus viviparus TaxID=29172 RepID=A0A0D8XCX7_DICVI|nr:hypothetical protein DICVIV_12391 [Dictyocaulus viviparus]
MIQIIAPSIDNDVEDQRLLPKCAEDVEHVTSTALWVLTNGETVTDEQLLRDRSSSEIEDSSSKGVTDSSSDNHCPASPSPNKEKWRNKPLHVEISMDTDVYVPDSPKMADLFEAVTRQDFNCIIYVEDTQFIDLL